MDTLASFPCKSTTDSLLTPHAAAMSSAKVAPTSTSCAVESSEYGKFLNSMVMRALPNGRQSAEPWQSVQSSCRKEPGECIHFPCGQMVHSVFAKSSFQEPAGQEAHFAAPIIVPYFPGGQRMHTLSFACPTAGW
jgi:hypothetical protein